MQGYSKYSIIIIIIFINSPASNAESTEGLNGQNESMNPKYRSHARDSLSSLDYEVSKIFNLVLFHVQRVNLVHYYRYDDYYAGYYICILL